VGSIEVTGCEFSACCASTSKKGYAIYGTSDGRLFYFKHSKEF
jgi:hypothetical protein